MLKPLRSWELAQEIASAVFRVSVLVLHSRLRLELEGVAVELVKEVKLDAADKLGRLVRLAEAVGEMSATNAHVLQRELENLKNLLDTEISESIFGGRDTIHLDQVFAEKAGKTKAEGGIEIGNQDDRQAAILTYIRKFPNGCRMRQLSVAFTSFSERTVRTDIGRLIDKGLVEKIGSKTGPFSYFRARSNSSDFQPTGANLMGAEPFVTKGEPAPF